MFNYLCNHFPYYADLNFLEGFDALLLRGLLLKISNYDKGKICVF